VGDDHERRRDEPQQVEVVDAAALSNGVLEPQLGSAARTGAQPTLRRSPD
jgi:hypothetical protein